MTPERKTGQQIDVVKEKVVIPVMAASILNDPFIKDKEKISFMDLGRGDSTSALHLMKLLERSGKKFGEVSLLEVDRAMIRDILEINIGTDSFPQDHLKIVEFEEYSWLRQFMSEFEESHDVATSQLVLHQITDEAEMLFNLQVLFQSLNSGGSAFVLDLHPTYLEYLQENYPDKLTLTSAGNVPKAIYSFDDGGEIEMCCRSDQYVLGAALGLGFEFVGRKSIIPDAIANLNPRYQDLVDRNIPMFSLMHLRKNDQYVVSNVAGVVSRTTHVDENYLRVVFTDGSEYRMPVARGAAFIEEGKHLLISEIQRQDTPLRIINYWVTAKSLDEADQTMRGGQLAFEVGD